MSGTGTVKPASAVPEPAPAAQPASVPAKPEPPPLQAFRKSDEPGDLCKA